MEAITEKTAKKNEWFFALLVLDNNDCERFLLLRNGILTKDPGILWFFIPLTLLIFLSFGGFMVVQPNDSRVLVLFGNYLGTVRQSGFHWVNPFTTKN